MDYLIFLIFVVLPTLLCLYFLYEPIINYYTAKRTIKRIDKDINI